MQADLGFHLDHARGDLDEAQSRLSNWATAKLERFGIAARRPPHQPVGAGMQEQPELVGRPSCAGGAVGGEMRLPRLDVVLGNAAPAVDILVERLGFATGKVVTMKRCLHLGRRPRSGR